MKLTKQQLQKFLEILPDGEAGIELETKGGEKVPISGWYFKLAATPALVLVTAEKGSSLE